MTNSVTSVWRWTQQHPLIIILVTAGVCLFGWLLWQGPWVLDQPHLDDTKPGPASVVSGFRTAVVASGAGVVAGVGLAYTHLTLKDTRANNERQAELTREGQITDRYTNAVKHLASEELIEQLGGIYALGRIMRDSEKDHTMVVEVIAAFIRKHAPASSPVDESAPQAPGDSEFEPDERVQVALTVLARRPPGREEPFKTDLSRIDLRGANLGGANLAGVNLIESQLQSAYLSGANLKGALLYGTRLEDADLDEAKLQKTQGLTVEQVVLARVTSKTKLPADLAADPRVVERIAAGER
ncbi:pentapeptide repeat-containing protein [Streptomyces maoxianensis]|uniref:Pentapeptide repeat-containing protein n=1 Tax=Streptomyces maoxianensis TaxID=1459942 RepID=A0ABV9GIA8_9ACTN